MAVAFHCAITDSSLGSDEVEEIKTGLRAAFANAAPPAPVVPDEWPKKLTWSHHDDISQAEVMAWNNAIDACRAAMLQGADGTLIREGTRQTDELVMWIKRLAYSLRKANPDSKLQNDAMEYLSRKGLIRVEDVLR
nr:ead/Ea22-like family protein [Citrobacter farmeri]